METNKLSWMERMIILWICLVAITILFSMVALVNNTDWSQHPFITGYTKITTKTINGKPPEISTEAPQGKAIWDWLQLLGVLAIPVVVVWFTQKQKKRDQEHKEQYKQTEQRIASDNQQETALQAYINAMSELLIDKKLRQSKPTDEIRTIARVRTITMLLQLDSTRIKYVFILLRESSLMNANKLDNSIVNLEHVNFSRVDWSHAILNKVDLRNVNFKGANLRGAYLQEANLQEADLSSADLRDAHLFRANLKGAHFSKAKFIIPNPKGDEELQGADLQGADLREADLDGADLHEAKYNTKVIQEKDEQGKPAMIEQTQWPNENFNPQAHGAICVDCKK